MPQRHCNRNTTTQPAKQRTWWCNGCKERCEISLYSSPPENCILNENITLCGMWQPISCPALAQPSDKKEYLGKIAIRIRQEFTQHDDEEYYLSSYDFEDVLDELNQELEDDEINE